MIFSTLLPALLAVGSLPSSIAEPSRLTRTREQPSSDEVGTSDRFEQIDKRARLTQTYSGEKIADRAEIAGLMATFRTAPYKASYFYIINEYGDDELVRQNACEQSSNGKLDYNMLFTVCVDMSMVDGVAGELTFDKMYMFQMNYRWITRQSTSSDENTLKPTVGSIINISDDEKDFEIQIQSEPDTMSKPIRIYLNDENCEHNSQLGKTDCLWSTPDQDLRTVEPYSWLPDVW